MTVKAKKRGGPRNGGEDRDEALRGRIRQLEKQVEQQNRLIRSLEKQLSRNPTKDIKKNSKPLPPMDGDDKKDMCPNCLGVVFRVVPIGPPNKEILWKVCQTCKSREKVSGK